MSPLDLWAGYIAILAGALIMARTGLLGASDQGWFSAPWWVRLFGMLPVTLALWLRAGMILLSSSPANTPHAAPSEALVYAALALGSALTLAHVHRAAWCAAGNREGVEAVAAEAKTEVAKIAAAVVSDAAVVVRQAVAEASHIAAEKVAREATIAVAVAIASVPVYTPSRPRPDASRAPP